LPVLGVVQAVQRVPQAEQRAQARGAERPELEAQNGAQLASATPH